MPTPKPEVGSIILLRRRGDRQLQPALVTECGIFYGKFDGFKADTNYTDNCYGEENIINYAMMLTSTNFRCVSLGGTFEYNLEDQPDV